ncbi:MAG TPA: HAMP domain-containing sensor histidine kinase [Pirellulales bacterium]|nr:HAMP domain-containing sensor histidine kinase [Pirellulales bacterium]
MIRPATTVFVFGLCLAVVLGVLAWASFQILRFDAAERESQHEAMLEENARLALWRMDSALGGLILQESVRPAAEYQRVHYLGRDGVSLSADHGGRPVFSPLANCKVDYVVAHLQVSEDGAVTSPRWPSEGAERAKGDAVNGVADELWRQVELLGASIIRQNVVARVPPPAVPVAPGNSLPAVDAAGELFATQSQQTRGAQEFRRRSEYLQNNSLMAQNPIQSAPADFAASGLVGGVMTPVVIDDRLLLARRVSLGGQEYLQVCWLDRPVIETWLTGLIADLLPQARLQLVPALSDEQLTRRLAALPLVLLPGDLPSTAVDTLSPLRWSLAIAWACVSVAALAVGVLLTGVVSLSERRAAFVSAVTHELRTPLTTLRMYAEMLAEGMVPAEADRKAYLETLHAEAERLGHLVENVLCYARLERGRSVVPCEIVSVGRLIDRAQERLAARCRQADMELVTEADDEVRGRSLRTNPASVEQILFNLVDNACKYASGASDRRIHLSAVVAANRIRLCIADHGPGLSQQARRRLFRPFSKSAEDSAGGAPGVGLGLSLCRRLARQLGGAFQLDQISTAGACFVLSFPIGDRCDSRFTPPATAER